MASIRKRVTKAGVPTWAVLYVKGKQQTSTTFADQKSAERFRDVANAAGVEAALQLMVPKTDFRTVDSLLDEWLEYKQLSMTTSAHRDYERACAKWIRPTFGWRDAELVTERDVQAWVDKTLRPSLQSKSIAKQHALLHGVYKWASSKTVGLIANDPCTETKLPRRVKRPPRGLSVPELGQLLTTGERIGQSDAADVIAVLAGTGWRPGEVLGLRAGFVEVMPNGRVYVTMTGVYRRGEGIVDGGKTEAAGRRVRVLGEGAAVLARRVVGLGVSSPVFPNPNPRPLKGQKRSERPTDNPWSTANFGRNYWPKIVKAAELEERAPTPYWLRHTHVALCHAAGLSLPEIQRRIGHESIQTTIDVYGRMIDGMSEESADKLDALLMPSNVVRGEVVA